MNIEQTITNAVSQDELISSSVQYRLEENQLSNKTDISLVSHKKMHYEHRS